MSLHIGLLLFVTLILSVSCQTNTREIHPKILDVFQGFDLETQGTARIENDGTLDETYVVPHKENEHSRPSQLQTGVQYVFHHRGGPANDEKLGKEQLPARLRELGFKVVEAPNYNGGRFSYGYLGGPFFHISFMDGVHKGVIFNKNCDWVRDKNWIVEDYVLVFLS
jgi:hypothetical protein